VVAFVVSILILVLMLLPVFYYAKRRKVGAPLTWGEAMVSGTWIFFVLFWAYGVVPHQFLTWADSELSWRPDKIWFGPNGSVTVFGATLDTPWIPIQISAQVFRDIIATTIYIVFLGIQMWFWVWWQNRDKRAEAAKAIEPTTPYGRPLIKRA
jgi:uncharacterized membrane protein